MKTLLKALKWVGLAVVFIAASTVLFVLARSGRTYDAPYPDITAVTDSALIARGSYIVNGPGHCADCHGESGSSSRIDAGEIVPLTGNMDLKIPPGVIRASNLTSDPETGIGSLSDGEIARALRFGVKPNGRPMFDIMPFYDLSDRDLTSVVSYLRTLEPIRHERQPTSYSFLGKALVAFGLLKPMGDGHVPEAPAPDSTIDYGRYLATSIANCRGCHTERDLMTGEYLSPDYSGGFKFEDITDPSSGRYFITPNLTPDPGTGLIANWSEQQFIARFRAGRSYEGSVMPWGPFGRMSDMELKAIFRFLNSLDPVKPDSPRPVGVQASG